MPSRPPSRGERSRAEARRRARLAAQGQLPDEEEAQPSTPASSTAAGGGGFLSRLFPPAPPLPGHERPLAGFDYAGSPRFRGLAETIWLLARNPLVWIGAGAVWAVSRLLTDNSTIGILMSVVSFGSLIAAGWFGWRRPWLYGGAAALLGWIAVLLVILTLVITNPSQVGSLLGTQASPSAEATPLSSAAPSLAASPAESAAASPAPSPAASPAPSTASREVTAAGVAFNIVLQTVLQLAIGVAAGWYGGYLRRRTAQPSSSQSRRRR